MKIIILALFVSFGVSTVYAAPLCHLDYLNEDKIPFDDIKNCYAINPDSSDSLYGVYSAELSLTSDLPKNCSHSKCYKRIFHRNIKIKIEKNIVSNQKVLFKKGQTIQMSLTNEYDNTGARYKYATQNKELTANGLPLPYSKFHTKINYKLNVYNNKGHQVLELACPMTYYDPACHAI